MSRVTQKLVSCISKTNTCVISRRYISPNFSEFIFGDNFFSKPTKREQNIKKIISVASIESKSKELLNELVRSRSIRVSLIHLEHLNAFLKKHHLARKRVAKDHGISIILNLYHTSRDAELRKQARVALALLGYVFPVKGNGVRILSLDGGGTRGVMSIYLLQQISEICQQPIHELFDLIVGASTGAILTVLLGIQNQSLKRCELTYDKLAKEIFQKRSLIGPTQLLYNHAYYDTAKFEAILKDELGTNHSMIDSAISDGPKVALVSTIVNHQQLKAFVFRNYSLPKGKDFDGFYKGTSKYKFWQAVRASTAAPGYFEEILLDDDIHQDGGLLNNNPTAVAIHEAKKLWPDTPIQAVVSVGTGTYHGRLGPKSPEFTTLRQKLMKLVYSATDVEGTHVHLSQATHEILQDLLPPSKYIRLNPNMSADVPLDVTDFDTIQQLRQDTVNYIHKFSHKFDLASSALTQKKSVYNRLKDRAVSIGYRNGYYK